MFKIIRNRVWFRESCLLSEKSLNMRNSSKKNYRWPLSNSFEYIFFYLLGCKQLFDFFLDIIEPDLISNPLNPKWNFESFRVAHNDWNMIFFINNIFSQWNRNCIYKSLDPWIKKIDLWKLFYKFIWQIYLKRKPL
jgi:hypothetical protein